MRGGLCVRDCSYVYMNLYISYVHVEMDAQMYNVYIRRGTHRRRIQPAYVRCVFVCVSVFLCVCVCARRV
jgi:hypothetical protein